MINKKKTIYFDYAATTPVDPRVLESMLPYFREIFGNTSSIHLIGQQAEKALEQSRRKVAECLNCREDEVIFTSSGSESDNLALRGMAFARRKKNDAKHILISPVEHHAVSRTAQQLAEVHGFELEFLPVNQYGQVNPKEVASRLREDTAIVSIIYANNEIGTINPIAEIGEYCQNRGIPFHTDAVQAAAYLPIDVQNLNIDLMSLGAHKFYGPKGVGVLYVRKNSSLIPQITGGNQEFGLRASTHNTPLIVGFAEALRLSLVEKENRIKYIQPLRDYLIKNILERIPDAQLTGHPTQRLPNHASFVFNGANGNDLLMMLDMEGFACSSGSACKSGAPEPSEVLTAIGISPERALGSLRITLGVNNQPEDVESLMRILPKIISRIREG